MASVASDTSAIQLPPPLPSRPDPSPAAGPSGTFADLLDAPAAPTAAPPSAQAPAARASAPASRADNTSQGQDASRTADAGPAAAAGPTAPPASAVAPGAGNGKVGKGSKDSKAADDPTGASGQAADPTVAGGLATPLVPIAVLIAAAVQSPPPVGEPQANAPGDPIPPANGDKPGKPADAAGDPGAPTLDPTLAQPAPQAAGLLAAAVPTMPAPAGPPAPPSAPTQAAIPTAIPAPSTAAAAGAIADPGTSASAPPPSGTSAAPIPIPPAPPAAAASVPDGTPAVLPLPAAPPQAAPPPAALSSPTALPAAVPPAVMPPAGRSAASPDPNAKAPVAGSSPTTAAASPDATLTPAILATSPTAPRSDQATGRSVADASTIPLGQPGAKPAGTPGRTDADGATDFTLPAAGGAPDAATSAGGNDQLGALIQPGFNPAMPAGAQPTPALWPTPPRTANAADPAIPVAAIPVEIVARVEAGQRHFEIRLDPPELGRIEVRLDVDGGGRATSHLIVDRADTLDLLRRDAPALERALHSAGLTTDDGALQFSLRDQSFAGRDQGAPAPVAPPARSVVPDGEMAPIDAAVRRYGQLMGLGGGVDIRV